jgi:hypothetical protein
MFVTIQVPHESHCLYSYTLTFVTLNILKYLLQLHGNTIKQHLKF